VLACSLLAATAHAARITKVEVSEGVPTARIELAAHEYFPSAQRPGAIVRLSAAEDPGTNLAADDHGACAELTPCRTAAWTLATDNSNCALGADGGPYAFDGKLCVLRNGTYRLALGFYSGCKIDHANFDQVACPGKLRWTTGVTFAVRDSPLDVVQRPGWASAGDLARAIEGKRVLWNGLHKKVRRASCKGLRRFGVDPAGDFHRFRCALTGVDGHAYKAVVAVTKSTTELFWWKTMRVTRG
jgi:hypothetical protein